MRKINELYKHEATGISVEVHHQQRTKAIYSGINEEYIEKRVTVKPSSGAKEFGFILSKPETLRKIGEAFVEIANFIGTL